MPTPQFPDAKRVVVPQEILNRVLALFRAPPQPVLGPRVHAGRMSGCALTPLALRKSRRQGDGHPSIVPRRRLIRVSEPKPEGKKPLKLDVDLDPAITTDELDDPSQTDEKKRLRSLLDDVPPHHGA